LVFELRSAADPTLVVPASHVWDSPAALRRWLGRPDEVLLGELGRASVVYPELASALRSARPEALEFDAAGVVDFLTTRADLLEQAGFEVLIPSWWAMRRKLGLKGKSSLPPEEGGVTQGMFGRDSLCAFSWELALGDDQLTAEELEALANAKVPLVFLRGEWVAFDPEQVQRALEFVAKADDDGQRTVADVLALATAHPDDIDTPLPVTSVEADGWLGDLLAGRAESAVTAVDLPPDFAAELRPYQERGLSWLAFLSRLGLGACLADDMGLGKTVQMLALESAERSAQPDAGPTLLLCPMSLVSNWHREAAKFAPGLRVYVHHGPGRARGDDLVAGAGGVDLVVTSYYTAVRDLDDLAGVTWARVVLDEAQAIKNSRSQTAQAVRQLKAPHRVALTGTPVENKLAELWSIMDFLNPGILGGPETFRGQYARPIERQGLAEPAERLRRVTRPYILRRLKTDKSIIDDLPDKIEIKERCFLTPEQASLYKAVVDEMLDKIENTKGIERKGNVLAAMTKLKQICNHPAQLLHDGSPVGRRSGKVIRLEEICEEILAEGDKALLFTQFTEFGDMLVGHLGARFGRSIAYLHGGTPRARRDEMVTAFAADDGPPLFLLSLKAGGTGLNLTAANHVIHLDRWWNPAVENQATDRAFRIGQTRNVQVRKFICTGTLEDKIDEMIEAKKALAELVVGDGEGWLTELNTSELRNLFTLSQEAIGE
jgi:SNF2 family DNA or RNA helicase